MTELPRLRKLYAGLRTSEDCNRELAKLAEERQQLKEESDFLYDNNGTIGMQIQLSDEFSENNGRTWFVEQRKAGLNNTTN